MHTFSTIFLGSRVLYTRSPANVKAIFATNFADYGQAYTRKRALGIFGPGIFTADGHAWRSSRDLLRPNLVKAQFADTKMLEFHVRALIGRINAGRPVQMETLFGELSMDIITDLVLGETTCLLSGKATPAAANFTGAFDYVSRRLSIRMGIGWLATLVPDPRFNEGVRDLKAFVHTYVAKAAALRKDKGKLSEEVRPLQSTRYVFLEGLAGSKYDEDRIAAELMNVITAGRGSVASLLAILWFTLARRKDVFDMLRTEVLDTLGHRIPTFEELKSLQFLNWTMKEGERYWLQKINIKSDGSSPSPLSRDSGQLSSSLEGHSPARRRRQRG